jgi:hypothetical protein
LLRDGSEIDIQVPTEETFMLYSTSWNLSAASSGGFTMDFIERIFGVSPDGGSGALEFLLFAVPIVGVYVIYRLGSRFSKKKR